MSKFKVGDNVIRVGRGGAMQMREIHAQQSAERARKRLAHIEKENRR